MYIVHYDLCICYMCVCRVYIYVLVFVMMPRRQPTAFSNSMMASLDKILAEARSD